MDPKTFFTVPQASEFLGVTIRTIYGYIQSRKIPYYKKTHKVYFKKEDIENWLESGRRMSASEGADMVKNDKFLKNI